MMHVDFTVPGTFAEHGLVYRRGNGPPAIGWTDGQVIFAPFPITPAPVHLDWHGTRDQCATEAIVTAPEWICLWRDGDARVDIRADRSELRGVGGSGLRIRTDDKAVVALTEGERLTSEATPDGHSYTAHGSTASVRVEGGHLYGITLLK